MIHDKPNKCLRPVRYSDVAILSRSHDGVKAYSAALSAQGIPVATAQPGLLNTPEATLALACLRRLNDPGDTVATAEIVSLADGLKPETWVTDRLLYLNKGAEADLWLEVPTDGHPAHPLLETIARLRVTLPVLAPKEALATVIAACGVSEKVVCWSADPDRARVRLANLEALLDLAEQYEDLCRTGQHAASVSGLILWLGEMAGEKKDTQAEPAIDAVKIMTHHAAKGLEWPVVVLTGLSSNIKDRLWSISAQSQSAFDARNPLADRFIRYWPWPFGLQQKVAVADDIALSPTAEEFRVSAIEESKRLLYVSMTRARDLLVLTRSSRKTSGEWLDSVDAAWLLPGDGESLITLPDGEEVAAELWALDPANDVDANAAVDEEKLYWLPLNTFSRHRQPLEEKFVGTHVINDRGSKITIRSCHVYPQPLGSYACYKALNPGLSHTALSVDPGYNTVDWFVCQGMVANDILSGAVQRGMGAVLRAIAEDLIKKHSFDATPASLVRTLDRSLQTGEPLRLYGSEFDLEPHLAAGMGIVEEAAQAVKNSVGSGENIDVIIMTGGGASLYAEAVANKFPRHKVVTLDAPALANVRGFHTIGDVLAQSRERAAKLQPVPVSA